MRADELGSRSCCIRCANPDHCAAALLDAQGYNGSQLWDTSFAAQALCDAGLGPEDVVDKVLRKAHSYVEQSQVGGCQPASSSCVLLGQSDTTNCSKPLLNTQQTGSCFLHAV